MSKKKGNESKKEAGLKAKQQELDKDVEFEVTVNLLIKKRVDDDELEINVRLPEAGEAI